MSSNNLEDFKLEENPILFPQKKLNLLQKEQNLQIQVMKEPSRKNS